MSSVPKYDFRDGILLEKVLYKDTSMNFGKNLLFILALVLTWCWGAAWFALFLYSYINYERTAFWVYIACWLAFAACVITFGVININISKNQKLLKKKLNEERVKKEEEIEKAKKQRQQKKSNQIKVGGFEEGGQNNKLKEEVMKENEEKLNNDSRRVFLDENNKF